ncbi:ATP-binding protein [bacterium]|nr:ATP-binding protein [bacterium]
MSYLDYFHFDKEPFPAHSFNYIYDNKKQFKIINEISETVRFNSGIYTIIGMEGVGKTFILGQIQKNLSNNDLVVFISVTEKTDILKAIAEQLSFVSKKQNIDDVFQIISKLHKKGQNIILLIDDMQDLDKSQIRNLVSLMEVVKYLKVVATGNKSLKKILRNKNYYIFREKHVKNYKISRPSFISATKYIKSISVDALSLSQYKNVIGFLPRMLIAFISNKNNDIINKITTDVIKDAYQEKSENVKIKNVYNVAKKNVDIVMENLYFKFQKVFLFILVILSIYYCFRLFADRQHLIQKIEVERSINEQEKSFEKLY